MVVRSAGRSGRIGVDVQVRERLREDDTILLKRSRRASGVFALGFKEAIMNAAIFGSGFQVSRSALAPSRWWSLSHTTQRRYLPWSRTKKRRMNVSWSCSLSGDKTRDLSSCGVGARTGRHKKQWSRSRSLP